MVAKRSRWLVAIVALGLTVLTSARAHAQVAVVPLSGTFTDPVEVVVAPGDNHRMYIVESTGVILLDLNGVIQSTPFLTLPKVKHGGFNLYALAFPPDYASSGLFYIDEHHVLNDPSGGVEDNVSGVVEYQRSAADPNVADPDSARLVISTDPMISSLHTGGDLVFQGKDLIFSTGDGDVQGDPDNSSQSLSSLLGKLLRIDPVASGSAPYTVPKSNPYASLPAPYNAIYANGLRNPWRFSLGDGGMFIGDPGVSSEDEVDWVSKQALRGANFGWNCYEGDLVYDADNSCPNATFPVYVYGPSDNPDCGSAVIGGLVVGDRSLTDLYGRYLFGDYCTGQLTSFALVDGMATDVEPVGVTVPQLTSINQGPKGHIYVTGEPSSGGTVGELVRTASGLAVRPLTAH